MCELATDLNRNHLQHSIQQIVKLHRTRWGGAPGGWIQARAVRFEKRLCGYANWFTDEFGMNPTIEHLAHVAEKIEELGLSTLAKLEQKAGCHEYRALFQGSKLSDIH